MATVFVTVGTTSFDELIETASSESFRGLLCEKGYKKLVLQIGRGEYVPQDDDAGDVSVSSYRYKDSLADDLRGADLVISHAGAGCILETLAAQKPLVVAVNETLMGNHQLELAKQLHRDGHIQYGTPRELCDIMKKLDVGSLRKFSPGKPELFGSWLMKTANAVTASQRSVAKVRLLLLAVAAAALSIAVYLCQ